MERHEAHDAVIPYDTYLETCKMGYRRLMWLEDLVASDDDHWVCLLPSVHHVVHSMHICGNTNFSAP